MGGWGSRKISYLKGQMKRSMFKTCIVQSRKIELILGIKEIAIHTLRIDL